MFCYVMLFYVMLCCGSDGKTTRKELPCDVPYRCLGIYGIEPDIYLINFKKRAPTERISKKLFNRLLQLAPKKDLSSIYSIDSEIELQ